MIMEEQFTPEMYEVDEFDGAAAPDTDDTPSPSDVDEFGEQHPGQSEHEEDLTTEVLRRKGISDLSKIQFEDETGAIITRSWDALSRDEQLNILSDQQPEETELEQDEIDLINTIRNSGMTVQDYVQSMKTPAAPAPEPPSYKINELSDDEVYALDLIDKVGSDNITDEEIEQMISNAKQNEKLYKKTVEGIRQEYIRAQQDEEAQVANEQAARQQEAYDMFATSITSEIQNLNQFVGQPLEMDAEDQQQLARFMLELDDNGISALGKALNNPHYLTEAAFWILNKDKITEELTKLMQNTYTRGYEQAKLDLQGKPKSKLAFGAKFKKNNNEIIDDDEWN